jgi:hypothetical protein
VLAEAGVADRCEVVPTDFFHSLVSGGDAYVLAQILHDWPDQMRGDHAEVCWCRGRRSAAVGHLEGGRG